MQQMDSLVEYGSRRVIITITAIFCALLEIVDTTIVNVALNNMRGSLGATLTEVAWVITAYAIGNVIIVPMTSWLSVQFGRRNYFAASIILFTICSFLCGNATGITELVIFRFLQGIGVVLYWLPPKQSLPKVTRQKKEVWRRLFMVWV